MKHMLPIAIVIFASLFAERTYGQSISIDLGRATEAGVTSKLVELTALVTALSLAPSILVMMTAFTRIVIVLSLLRNALSVQSTPPNTVLTGLALFLTFFVMQPTLEQSWRNGIDPMSRGQINEIDGIERAAGHLQKPLDRRLIV